MINLGDEVKDKVSGFKGIATARHSYLDGCDRITIQPPIDKEKKHQDCHTFDEPQLTVVKKAKVKRQATLSNPGGPEKFSDVREY